MHWNEGLSLHQIADRIGVPHKTFRVMVARRGMKRRSRAEGHALARKQGRMGTQRPNPLRGPDAPNWRGGISRNGGYVYIHVQDPVTGKGKYKAEHTLVWEKHSGKPLEKGMHIHHVNGVKDDNRPENLMARSLTAHALVIPKLQERIRELEAKCAALEQTLLKHGYTHN